jgi:N-acetyl-anhydromuramyl-L-alanine amidase AmpD
MLTMLLILQLAILHPKPLHHEELRETEHSYIVIHSTEDCSNVKNVIRYLRRTSKSYHYLIAKDGTITELLDPLWQGAHAGLSFYDGMWHWNRFAIGISFMNGCKQPYTEAQYRSGKALITMLEQRYPDIDSTKIVTHHQISIFRGKKDPGPLFEMKRILPDPLDKSKPPL